CVPKSNVYTARNLPENAGSATARPRHPCPSLDTAARVEARWATMTAASWIARHRRRNRALFFARRACISLATRPRMRFPLARGATVGVLILVAALPALFLPARTRACSLGGNFPFTTDPEQVGVDRTAPQLAQPTVSVEAVDNGDQGCQSKCGFDFRARLSNLATDDITPVDRM